ncbi:MAG TPA: aspartate aminotransferase family protein [Acidimicrobiaceae bacterium]|nr:aspartate aminotransferase family protein [Actinomycetota bacterium]HAN08024.1 aspartate aminotransferase family protein [Acidimicrobiaceae bacterium]
MSGSYPESSSKSAELYERARRVIPDGASRSTVLIKPHPVYVAEGEGAWVMDVDGNRYLDCNNNFTSIILGHADPQVERAVQAQMKKGTAFSFATELEIELAELLCARTPSFEKIRFCNSGTEAVMGMIKAARAFTSRAKIIKVEGSYHGTYDHAEASLGSDPSNWGSVARPETVPYALGAPKSLTEEVRVISFNDVEGARKAIAEVGDELAAVLVDPMPSRVGMPQVEQEFIFALREATRSVGALLILDEVITYRLASGGAQTIYPFDPDLTALAKIIGGGFPVGAIAGREEVMNVFTAMQGDRAAVPSGGTYTANPITMAAGLACMKELQKGAFSRLEIVGQMIRSGLRELFDSSGLDWQVTGAGSLFRIHPHSRPIRSYRDAMHSSDESQLMLDFQQLLLEREVYFSGYGMGCLNLATSDLDVKHFLTSVNGTFKAMVDR